MLGCVGFTCYIHIRMCPVFHAILFFQSGVDSWGRLIHLFDTQCIADDILQILQLNGVCLYGRHVTKR